MREATPMQRFLLEKVGKHPTDIIAITARRFKVSVQAVHKQLKPLLASGQIVKTGKTRTTRYQTGAGLKRSPSHDFLFPLSPKLEEHLVWEQDLAPLFATLPPNVR